MSRILLIGKSGQLGWELQHTLMTLGEVIALDRCGMDLADPDSVRRAVRQWKPSLIVNAAAYTAVDKAESEPELAMAINGTAPAVIAEEAKRLGAAIVHYSTDYVFDGKKSTPYEETDIPNPLNVYGRTKLAGELALQQSGVRHLILRTSWIYAARGRNVLLTILKLAQERDSLQFVNDQIGAPTWAREVAEATAQLLAASIATTSTDGEWLRTGSNGLYHLTASSETSWYGFARAILDTIHSKVQLIPVSSADYPTAAERPKNSRMSNRKLTRDSGLTMSSWERSMVLCLEELAA